MNNLQRILTSPHLRNSPNMYLETVKEVCNSLTLIKDTSDSLDTPLKIDFAAIQAATLGTAQEVALSLASHITNGADKIAFRNRFRALTGIEI